MGGVGIEKSGQQYPLFVEESIHDAAFEQRQRSYDEMTAAEQNMHHGVDGGARTYEVARHDYHRQRVMKLTQFCISQGLLDRNMMA